jgi:hypothetical protein
LRERAQASREKGKDHSSFKWLKDHAISVVKESSKQRIKINTSKQEEEILTKERGTLLHKACGKVFEELQGTREWLILYQVHLFMFPVLYIFL